LGGRKTDARTDTEDFATEHGGAESDLLKNGTEGEREKG
jgi:hypothetical protein